MGVGIILDLIILAVLGLSIFLGHKKGLIGVVFNLCALVVAIIVTAILYNPVTTLVINNTQIDDNIKTTIIEKGMLEKNAENGENEKSLTENIETHVTNTVKDGVNNAVEKSAGVIAEKVVAIGVAIALFIVVRIGLIFVKFIAEGLAELPIIKQFNKLGGTAYGILRGIIIVYAFFAICYFIINMTGSEFMTNMINTSLISKYLYAHNLILAIFTR